MQQVLTSWRRDERNHFIGFRRVYQLFYAEEENQITEKVFHRVLNYSSLDPSLVDEFSLCLLLAYDELVSAKGYAADCQFYDQLGPAPLQSWIRRVAGDEAMHYGNFLNVLRQNHRSRLAEADEILSRIFALDVASKDYNGGFVFDHKDESFDTDFLKQCAQKILASINK
jgi:hypothetical protein